MLQITGQTCMLTHLFLENSHIVVPNNYCLCSTGEEWKKTRSNAAKQVVPRRVGSFVEPLSVIAEELLSHFETLQDEAGNVQDIRDEMYKWAFQGKQTI